MRAILETLLALLGFLLIGPDIFFCGIRGKWPPQTLDMIFIHKEFEGKTIRGICRVLVSMLGIIITLLIWSLLYIILCFKFPSLEICPTTPIHTSTSTSTPTPTLTETDTLLTDDHVTNLSDTKTPTPPYSSTPAPVDGQTITQVPAPTGWQEISDLPHQINALVVDPTNPHILYAATGDYAGSGSGVYKSEDTGLTWHKAATGLPYESVTALALSPGNPATLYAMAGVRGDVFTSTDGSANWSFISNTDLFGGFERRLLVDPRNPYILFVLDISQAVVRSRDGGYNWQPIGEGLPGDEISTFVLSLAVDPSDSNIIYVGTGGFVGQGQGVYKSTDAGATWSAVNRGMLDYRITALAVDPFQTHTVYAGSDGGNLFKSTNGGQTWEELTEALPIQMSDHPTIQDIIIHPQTSDTVYLLVDDAGVIVSEDSAKWRLLGQPGQFSYTSFTAMAIIFDTEPILFVCIEDEGCWRYIAF